MMAFADSDNNVYILNCQDKDVIHRVQMPLKEGQHKDDMKICKTYILKFSHIVIESSIVTFVFYYEFDECSFQTFLIQWLQFIIIIQLMKSVKGISVKSSS